MKIDDAADLVGRLTDSEKIALLSLPVKDSGGLSEEAWWAYYAIMDAGLSTPGGDCTMIATPLGEAVIRQLGEAAQPDAPTR